MKIALLANWGGTIHGVRWANSLAERGHDVHLISAHPKGEALHRGVTLHLLALRPPFAYFLAWPMVRAILKKIKPDLMHVHRASGYGTLGQFTDFHPRILSVWGADVYDTPKESAFGKAMVVRNLTKADWVCSTSNTMAQQVRLLCPNLPHVSITPFGIDTKRFIPSPALRSGEEITIGTVKTLETRYGIDLLIKGFAQAKSALQKLDPALASKMRLYIAGSGSQMDALQKLAQELNVMDVAEFAGRIPHTSVPTALSKLDIYVAASRSDAESFGVAILEASSCAVPVIVANVGGLPEVVQDGKTGIIVAREDAQAIADSIVHLALNADLRRAMGAAGREFVVEQYDWQRSVDIMEQVYRDVCGSRQLRFTKPGAPVLGEPAGSRADEELVRR